LLVVEELRDPIGTGEECFQIGLCHYAKF
jgi:hypothetical protein